MQDSSTCRKSRFISLRHKHLHNITSGQLFNTCHNVTTQSPLQTLTGEAFCNRTASVRDVTKLNIGTIYDIFGQVPDKIF